MMDTLDRVRCLGLPAILLLSLAQCAVAASPGDLFQKIECLEIREPLSAAELDEIRVGNAATPRLRQAVRALQARPDWRECAGDRLDVGFSKSAHWWRMSRPRIAAHNEDPAILTFRWKTLSKVDLFVFARDAEGALTLIERQTAGDDRPRSLWPLMTGDYPAFEITAASDREYFLRVQSRSIQRFPIELHSPESFQNLFNAESMIIWIFAGVIFTVVLLSALFSIGLGEGVYFYYGLYTVALWMSLNSIYGNTFRVFWPESPWLAHKMIFLTQGVVLWASIVFFRKVCRLEILSPRTDQFARVFQYAAAILAPLTLLDVPREFFSRLYSFTYLFAIPTFIVVMIRLVVVKKQRNLIPFAAGWGLYYSMGIVHLTYLFGLVPHHPVPVYGMVLMLPVETIVFGGGLFVRYRAILNEGLQLRREKDAALERLREFHNPAQYTSSKLGGLDVEALLLRLDEMLERDRIYRDEHLSLKKLAGLLGITAHQLSELLNSRLNVSFPALLVNYRVRAAAALLLEAPEKTALAIGLEVGFNSKTAFNVAFKKVRGESPTQFRAGRSPRASS